MADKKQMPPTMAVEKFQKDIVELINGCGLHPCFIRMILVDMVKQVSEIERKQLEAEKKEYEEGGDS